MQGLIPEITALPIAELHVEPTVVAENLVYGGLCLQIVQSFQFPLSISGFPMNMR